MSNLIKCKFCKKLKPHYAKGLCQKCYKKQYNKINGKVYYQNNKEKIKEKSKQYRYTKGSLSMNLNKSCSSYLGVHIAEQVLFKIFKNVKQMPPNNAGYDFICNKGMKIDVKSSTFKLDKRRKKLNGRWYFTINKNTIPDYFLCIAFDNRKNLNPLYLWLIPANKINYLKSASISKSTINKWSQYSQPINKVIACCNKLK